MSATSAPVFCSACGGRLRGKGQYPIVFRTAFGHVPLASPRFYRCRCHPADSQTFSPLAELFTEHTTLAVLPVLDGRASIAALGRLVRHVERLVAFVRQRLLSLAMVFSVGFLLIVSLVGTDMTLSYLKVRWHRLDRWLEGLPIVIVENGTPLRDRMRRARVDDGDILAAARELQGLERMDQIKYAVLERSGGISIIPVRS